MTATQVCTGCWFQERCYDPDTCPCPCGGDHTAWLDRDTEGPVTCPLCGAGPAEHCAPGCPAIYRQQAGQHRHDGADYLRDLWRDNGAPTKPPQA